MSVRPKSAIRKSTVTFRSDLEINKGGEARMGTKVRIRTSPEEFHMLFADSFGTRIEEFLEVNPIDPSDTIIRMHPHQNNHHLFIRVKNYSYGGRTLANGLHDGEIEDILTLKPRSIIVMLGMVDIAQQRSDNITITNNWYKDSMISMVTSVKESLRNMSNSVEDSLYINNLVFHFSYLQHWGTDYTPRDHCISPETAKEIRNKNMKKAIRFKNELFDSDIVMIDLNVNNPVRIDRLHYDTESSRKLFKRMKRFFFRFHCSRCGIVNRRSLAYSSRNHHQESHNLIYAPSCEGDLAAEEGILD